ncbi:MAG: ice-binding family protein, partial [Planctomycetota bacterium]
MSPRRRIAKWLLENTRSPKIRHRNRRTGSAVAQIELLENRVLLSIDLGLADSFAVLAGQAVTTTGPSTIDGNVGTGLDSGASGFLPGTVTNGAIHQGDLVATQAESDLLTAYNAAAGKVVTTVLTGQDLGGLTLTPGVYLFSSSAQLTGTLILDAQGNPNAEFVFKIGSTLVTSVGANVVMIHGGDPCDVYWQVGSSATLGTNTAFAGHILALTSITLNTGASVNGSVLAINGAVTLDSNSVSIADCLPVLKNPSSISVTENDPATPINAGISVTDSGTSTLSGGSVTLTNYAVGQDVLGFINDGLTMGNIAITTNVAGVISLTSSGASATTAEWQAALRSVTYTNTSDNPLTATRNVIFTTINGLDVTTSLASTIQLTAVNDPGVLSISGNINYVQNDPATAIDTGLVLTDIDSSEEHATITITNFVAGQDVLAFTNDGLTMGNIAVTSNAGGVLFLTSNAGGATKAQWQTALRSVTYLNTSATPDTTLRNITFTVQSGTGVSNALASTINVNVLGVLPVLGNPGNISLTENDPATAINAGITVTDAGSSTLSSATVTLTNYATGQDVLGFVNDGLTMGNIAVATNVAGILSLASSGASATTAEWQAALRSVTYTNTSDNPLTATRNVTFTANDGTAVSNSLASTIQLTAVNEPGVLSIGGNITYVQNDPATAIDTGLVLTDIDSSEQHATITIANFVAGQDGLTMGNIIVTSNAGGVLFLTSDAGTATKAEWQTSLRTVTYLNTSATPDTTVRNVTITVQSGTGVSNALASTINVNVLGVLPVLGSPGNIPLTENDPATPINAGITVTDAGASTLSSATVTLTNYAAGQDVLGFNNDGLTMGNIAVATNVAGILTLTSSGASATTVEWQAALRSVTYTNTSDNPLTATRNVTFTANDGTAVSNSLASTIQLTAINDPGVLSISGNINYVQNDPATAIDTGLVLTDIDSSEEHATITITNFVAGQDVLAFTNDGLTMGNITVTSNAGGVLFLTSDTGTATKAEWQAALRSVTYLNTSATPDTTARNVTFTVQSGTGVSDALASTVNVNVLTVSAAAFDMAFHNCPAISRTASTAYVVG